MEPVFSDRARKVLQLANQEAQRLNHAVIGTEHLLLGLVKEGLSPAAKVLKALSLDFARLRRKVTERHPVGRPDLVMPGRLPLAPQANTLLTDVAAAAEEARLSPITPELLLVALVGEREGLAAQVLAQAGVNLAKVKKRLTSMV
jgi:ATP-dependent Clp protease ATP-binding subunit ClpC